MNNDNLPRVGSALIVVRGDSILLAKRNKNPNMGKWILPGGKIEPFESISAAGKREIMEEAGIEVAVGEQIGVFEIISSPDEHRLVIYSWAQYQRGDLRAGSDALEPKFFTKEEIEKIETTEIVSAVLRRVGWKA